MLLVTDAMGFVRALLFCVLAVGLTKGLHSPSVTIMLKKLRVEHSKVVIIQIRCLRKQCFA